MTELVLHTVVTFALIATYLVLTLTGHDGNLVFGLLGGQGIGAGVSSVARRQG